MVSARDIEGLLDQARVAARVSAESLGPELELLADAALADMARVGVPDGYVAEGPALVRAAVCTYCKARFGFDNADAERLDASWRQALCDLANGYSMAGGAR